MAMIFLLHRSRGKWRVTCRLDWSRGTKLVNNAWSRRWKIKRSNTCALFTICKPNQFTSALSLYVQCPFRTWPTIILHNLPSFVSLSNITLLPILLSTVQPSIHKNSSPSCPFILWLLRVLNFPSIHSSLFPECSATSAWFWVELSFLSVFKTSSLLTRSGILLGVSYIVKILYSALN